MKRHILYITLLAFMVVQASAQTPNAISIQATEPTIVINKNIYGHFAEHLGLVFTVVFTLVRLAKKFQTSMASEKM